jgi:hypothetical protein
MPQSLFYKAIYELCAHLESSGFDEQDFNFIDEGQTLEASDKVCSALESKQAEPLLLAFTNAGGEIFNSDSDQFEDFDISEAFSQ